MRLPSPARHLLASQASLLSQTESTRSALQSSCDFTPDCTPLPATPTQKLNTMADASAQPKPSSSVKLVLLGEAAVGKV